MKTYEILSEVYGRNPDTMSPGDYDRYQQNQMDSERRNFLEQKLSKNMHEVEKLEIEVIPMDQIRFPKLEEPVKYKKQVAKKFSF